MIRIVCLAVVSLSLCPASVTAAEPEPPSFVLFPVTTALQRTMTSSATDAYCVINASRINQGGQINAAEFDQSTFKQQLEKIAANGGDEILVYLRFEDGQTHPEADEFLMAAVKHLCREAGFKKIRTGQQYTGRGWNEQVRKFANGGSDSDLEPVIENEFVRVSPVRTRLSRFLTNGAGCFVEVRRPIDGRMSGLPKETRQSIAQLLGTLEFEHQGRMILQVSSTSAGAKVIDQLVENRGSGSISPADRFAEELGFESMSVSHSPNGGTPETLLGAAAPDFSLESLNGGDIRLKDATQGRVALISFWGVACGPCRVEAPYLSNLHNRYEREGLTIIAVNAYDESREIVSEYAKQEKLTHPIALMGGQVAKEDYGVGAYPTTFWVDRTGTVVDYIVSFDPGDEKRMADAIEKLLKADVPVSP